MDAALRDDMPSLPFVAWNGLQGFSPLRAQLFELRSKQHLIERSLLGRYAHSRWNSARNRVAYKKERDLLISPRRRRALPLSDGRPPRGIWNSRRKA